jgi:hypothetical protein
VEPEDEGLDLPPFNWEKLFRWLFLIGLALWVLGGTIGLIINGYFTSIPGQLPPGPFLESGSETATKIAATIYILSFTVQGIAFRVWIASGVLLVFLWVRARTSHAAPPARN